MAWAFIDEEEDLATRGGSLPLSDILRGPMGPIGPVGQRPSPLGMEGPPNLPGGLQPPPQPESPLANTAKGALTAASFMVPGMQSLGPLAPLGRMGAQALLGAGEEALGGGSPIWGAAKGGALGGVGELAGKAIQTGAGIAAGAKEPTERLVKFLQENVPPLQGLTDLGSMIAGRGKKLVQDMMQASEERLIAKAGDRMIPLQTKDIDALGLKSYPSPNPLLGPDTKLADARDVIKAIKGRGDADEREMYNRVLAILEANGLKDEAAHAAYKNYTGIRDFLEQTGALKGNRLDVQKLRRGLQDTKIQDRTIGWRGMGNAEEGPLAASIQGIRPLDLKGPLGALGAGLGTYAGAATHMPHVGWIGGGAGAGLGGYLGNRIGPLNVKQVEPPVLPQDIAALLRYLLD